MCRLSIEAPVNADLADLHDKIGLLAEELQQMRQHISQIGDIFKPTDEKIVPVEVSENLRGGLDSLG